MKIAQTALDLHIQNEYANLNWVLVHEPGPEVDRLTIKNREEYLFEDIPYLPTMKEEHRAFVKEMQKQSVNVLYLEHLLSEILAIPEVCKGLVRTFCWINLQPSLTSVILDNYDQESIGRILLHGITTSELRSTAGVDLTQTEQYFDPLLLHPSPNLYFTRDPAAIVDNCILSCKMHYTIRTFESFLVREIFRVHPLFNKAQFAFGNIEGEDRPYTLEGGDVIVLNEDAIAIGRSQRTRSESIAIVAQKLFQANKLQRVYEINIPARREYMHLDTVFTIVNRGVVVAFPGVMDQVTSIKRYEPLSISADEILAFPVQENRSFHAILKEEFGGLLDVIHTGDNEEKYAEREQRSDGTNVLAIKPGTVMTYDRNPRTNQALRSHGIEVIEIEGSELVRGLGGPRCMTMPLVRQE